MLTECSQSPMRHVSCVMCHMSRVTYHVSILVNYKVGASVRIAPTRRLGVRHGGVEFQMGIL